VRGAGAFVVGLFSVGLFALLGQLTSGFWSHVGRVCGSLPCALQVSVLPAFLNWLTALVMLASLAMFINWARGALDLHGPYQRRLLAPGIWFDEKALLKRVAQELARAHLPAVDEETVLNVATVVAYTVPGLLVNTPASLQTQGHVDPEAVLGMFRNIRVTDRLPLHSASRQVVLTAVVGYCLDVYERALQVWPWRAKLVHY